MELVGQTTEANEIMNMIMDGEKTLRMKSSKAMRSGTTILGVPGAFSAQVYRLDGDWYMDDPEKEIVLEELIRGMPEIIEHLVGKRTDRFMCTFSDRPLPGKSEVLQKDIESEGGCWYMLQGTSLRGWLCPTIFRYFNTVPQVIYLHMLIQPTKVPMSFERGNKKGNKK